MRLFTAIGLAATTLLAGAARGEILRFRDGTIAHLEAVVQGGSVRVASGGRTVVLAETDLREILPGHWADREWPAHREAARLGGAPERLAAARWALDRGLVAEAVTMYRHAREADPRDPAASRLGRLADRLEAEARPADVGPLIARLGGDFRAACSRHLVLIHRGDDSEARRRLEFLETVYAGFFLALAELGVDLELPGVAQVMIQFPDRPGYAAFLRAEGASAFLNTCGYHHPTLGIVAVCDDCGVGTADPVDPALRLAREVRREQVTLGTAAHELVHRLVAASGLEPRPGRFPAWFHEGLAMQFEAVRDGRWAGLTYPSPQRLADWESLNRRRPGVEANAARALEAFGTGYDRERYATAWRAVDRLRTAEPGRFAATLDRFRRPPPAPGESIAEGSAPTMNP